MVEPIDWREWLQRWYRVHGEPGKKYSSARQLSMAISEGRNPGAVGEIEAKGITTIERLVEVSRATDYNPILILMEMGVVSGDQMEAMGLPRTFTYDQERALQIGADLADTLRRGWLESGEGLLALQKELDQ